MAKHSYPRRNQRDSPPHGNDFNAHAKGKWPPMPKPTNSNPPSPSGWESKSPYFRPSQSTRGGFKEPRYPSRTRPGGFQHSSRVEKPKFPNNRAWQGAGWRPISPNEPFSKKRDSATDTRRNVDEALDNIIRYTRPRTRSQTQLENSQPPNPFNQPTSNPSPSPWGRKSVNKPLITGNPFQNSGFGSRPQSGYQQPTVEDAMDTESDQQDNGNGQTLSPSGPVLMGQDNGISPRTGPGKTVHWADNLSGSVGTEQPGVKAPAKPSFSHYPPLPMNSSSSQLVPPPGETPKPKQPPVFGVTSGHPTPSSNPPPPGPPAFGATFFVHPTPTPDLRNTGSSTPPSQGPPPKTPHTSGVTSSPPTQVPSPPTTPRRSPRFQNPQSTLNFIIDSSPSNTIVQAELEHLKSSIFNPRLIRPVTDLSQIFSTMMGTFGEPGTGTSQNKFIPPSPRLSPCRPGFGGGLNESRTYQGRQYSIKLSMKSRRMEVELLRARISHAMLLSFDLSTDARHDAINIGDMAEFAVGHDTNLPGVSYIRATDLEFGRTNGTGRPTAGASRAGTNLLSGRSGSRKRNSDPEAWRNVNGNPIRRRESDEDPIERDRRINRRKAIAQGVAKGDPRAIADANYIMGETSTVNTMIWRFVRLSALVEMDVMIPGRIRSEKRGELQSAWWAVPEKSITGINF